MPSPVLPVGNADVRAIITTTLGDSLIAACIAGADALVQDLLTNTSLSSTSKFEVERWLAAHMVALNDPAQRIAMEKVGQLEREFTDRGMHVGALGLDYTRFGQMAQALDWTGLIRRANKNGKMTFKVIHSNVQNAEYIGVPDVINIGGGVTVEGN